VSIVILYFSYFFFFLPRPRTHLLSCSAHCLRGDACTNNHNKYVVFFVFSADTDFLGLAYRTVYTGRLFCFFLSLPDSDHPPRFRVRFVLRNDSAATTREIHSNVRHEISLPTILKTDPSWIEFYGGGFFFFCYLKIKINRLHFYRSNSYWIPYNGNTEYMYIFF